jgi:ribonuclease R
MRARSRATRASPARCAAAPADFTSPIRRYPDLSVHRILKYTLANGAPAAAKHYAAFAAESAERSSENELRALSAERDIEDLYKVIYMQKAVGETFDAVISSVTSFGLFCELENTCEGLIPIERLGEGYSFSEDALTLSRGKHAYKLGQPLRVRVTEANVLRRRVYMELAEEESGKKKR